VIQPDNHHPVPHTKPKKSKYERVLMPNSKYQEYQTTLNTPTNLLIVTKNDPATESPSFCSEINQISEYDRSILIFLKSVNDSINLHFTMF
jgi:hypothetical protein